LRPKDKTLILIVICPFLWYLISLVSFTFYIQGVFYEDTLRWKSHIPFSLSCVGTNIINLLLESNVLKTDCNTHLVLNFS